MKEEMVEITEIWKHDGGVVTELVALLVNGEPYKVPEGVAINRFRITKMEADKKFIK